MSLEAITWALREPVKPAVRKLVLIKLCDNADEETGRCFPSVGNIARVAGCDVRTVQRQIQHLIESGHIRVVEHGGTKDGVRRANTYRVTKGWRGETPTPRHSATGAPGTLPPPPPAECQGTPGTLPEQPVIEPVIKGKEARTCPAVPAERVPVRKKEKPVPTREQEIAIVTAYLTALPTWPTVTSSRWGKSRARDALLAVWAREPDARDPDFWSRFFATVRRQKFWNTGNGGRPIDQARFSWLMTPSKFDAVVELMDEQEASR